VRRIYHCTGAIPIHTTTRADEARCRKYAGFTVTPSVHYNPLRPHSPLDYEPTAVELVISVSALRMPADVISR